MDYSYVYRITNKCTNKHYYGSRTSDINPSNDLGFRYFSSSTDKEFIKDQKKNPNNYKYKIIKIFAERKEALKFEIALHNKFNVGVSESFYNKVKQTSVGFDRTNTLHTLETRNKISESCKGLVDSTETKLKKSEANKGTNNPCFGLFGNQHPASNRIITNEYRDEISKRTKGKIIGGKLTCEHCGKSVSSGNYSRWHGEKCKFINNLNKQGE